MKSCILFALSFKINSASSFFLKLEYQQTEANSYQRGYQSIDQNTKTHGGGGNPPLHKHGMEDITLFFLIYLSSHSTTTWVNRAYKGRSVE